MADSTVGIVAKQTYHVDPNRRETVCNIEVHFTARKLTVAFDEQFTRIRFVRQQTLAGFKEPVQINFQGEVSEKEPIEKRLFPNALVDKCEAFLEAQLRLKALENEWLQAFDPEAK